MGLALIFNHHKVEKRGRRQGRYSETPPEYFLQERPGAAPAELLGHRGAARAARRPAAHLGHSQARGKGSNYTCKTQRGFFPHREAGQMKLGQSCVRGVKYIPAKVQLEGLDPRVNLASSFTDRTLARPGVRDAGG